MADQLTIQQLGLAFEGSQSVVDDASAAAFRRKCDTEMAALGVEVCIRRLVACTLDVLRTESYLQDRLRDGVTVNRERADNSEARRAAWERVVRTPPLWGPWIAARDESVRKALSGDDATDRQLAAYTRASMPFLPASFTPRQCLECMYAYVYADRATKGNETRGYPEEALQRVALDLTPGV